MTALLQALCCICGNLRTCRRPRNHRGENLWLRSPVDLDWHRETGDLKCDECGRITTHAILLPDNSLRDHAERIALAGAGWHLGGKGTKEIQERWHQGPQNPRLHHLWFTSDERSARERGLTHMPAICKAQIPIPELAPEERKQRGTSNTYPLEQLVAPRSFDSDEDIDGWRRISCVDCYRRSNAIALGEQREQVKLKLQKYAGQLDTLDAVTLTTLFEQFRAAEGG